MRCLRTAKLVVLFAGIAAYAGAAASPIAAAPVANSSPAPSQPIVIHPMTRVDVATGAGYFSDPFPVKPFSTNRTAAASQTFTGTTNERLTCSGPIVNACFDEAPLQLAPGSLQSQLYASGTKIMAYVAKSVYRDRHGLWHMVASAAVNRTTQSGRFWYVLIHLHPINAAPSADLPAQWSADAVLVGSLLRPEPANYAGKYFEDGHQLYLVYVKRISATFPDNGIVAQQMLSPVERAASAPVTLLAPSVIYGGYNSENFLELHPRQGSFKLNETGNVTRIGNKYVMAYSTGAYDRPDYKIGIAWSDTFLPRTGQTYAKVLKVDTAGVWGVAGHNEVEYLLQSQMSAWPHYVRNQVIAPGVPSILQDDAGSWKLFFAGYAPGDAPISADTGSFDARHRRPYFMPINIAIPPGASVSSTSPFELGNWLTPR